MFYSDCVKMCEDFATSFGKKRTGSCIKTTPSHTSHPTFGFPQLKTNLKGCHFDTSEVTGKIAGGAEHPHRTQLPGCILKIEKALGTVHTCGRGLLQG
jgi:hypothetical protein